MTADEMYENKSWKPSKDEILFCSFCEHRYIGFPVGATCIQPDCNGLIVTADMVIPHCQSEWPANNDIADRWLIEYGIDFNDTDNAIEKLEKLVKA